MSSLRQKLNDLASIFADGVLDAIRVASIDELSGQGGPVGQVGHAGRGGRRSVIAGASMAEGALASAGAGAGRRRGGRLARRSATDIASVVEQIVELLRAAPKGLRAEQIRAKLGLEAKELPRPLKEAVEAGRLGKSGQKRATTYFLEGGGAGAAPRGGRAGGSSRASGKARRGSAKRQRKASGAARPARTTRTARPTRTARTARKARKARKKK
ncbi:MAG TPA: hypothetical protein VGG39_09545 [Polyangiaceae bacterium]